MRLLMCILLAVSLSACVVNKTAHDSHPGGKYEELDKNGQPKKCPPGHRMKGWC